MSDFQVKYIPIFLDGVGTALESLSDEQAGAFVKTIIGYVNGKGLGEVSDPIVGVMVQMYLPTIKSSFESQAKAQKMVNGKKAKSASTNTSTNISTNLNTNLSTNLSTNISMNDKEEEKEEEEEKEKEKEKEEEYEKEKEEEYEEIMSGKEKVKKEKPTANAGRATARSGVSDAQQIKNDIHTYCVDQSTQETDEPLETALLEFVKMRKTIKKPLTPYALKKALDKLDTLALDNVSKLAIVNQSVEKSWQSFYPVKHDDQKKEETPVERMKRIMGAEWFEDDTPPTSDIDVNKLWRNA